jgi:hypothetical protein
LAIVEDWRELRLEGLRPDCGRVCAECIGCQVFLILKRLGRGLVVVAARALKTWDLWRGK